MSTAKYLTPDELITRGFFTKPTTVITEAGNGTGKTKAVCDLISKVYSLGIFDRIYYMSSSHEACNNAINKLIRNDVKVIWHIGIEKYCKEKKLLSKYIELGVPLSYVCKVCPLFKGKHKIAYKIFENLILDKNVKILLPKRVFYDIATCEEVCIQPLIRAFSLNPTFELTRRLKLGYTPVIVSPAQLLLNHVSVSKWVTYGKRQKTDKKVLLIVDEADVVFYNALLVKVYTPNWGKYDREILEAISPKTKRLDKIITIYNRIYDVIKSCSKKYILVPRKEIKELEELMNKANPLISSLRRRISKAIEEVEKRGEKTFIFTALDTLQSLSFITFFYYSLRTAEDTGEYINIEDYEFGVKMLLYNDFPYRYFWKVCLTATFPTEGIARSEFLSLSSRVALSQVRKKTKLYENVYFTSFTLFERIYGAINRNDEIDNMFKYSPKKVVDIIKSLVEQYEKKFNKPVKGLCLWFGNKKQYTACINFLKRYRRRFEYFSRFGKSAIITKIKVGGRVVDLFISYCGSSVARSIDLQQYQISIVVAPLLRPPRKNAFYDAIDFSRAIASVVQAVMRIVRSPAPTEPKLIALESSITSGYYKVFYPEWFVELAKNYRLE